MRVACFWACSVLSLTAQPCRYRLVPRVVSGPNASVDFVVEAIVLDAGLQSQP